MNSNNKNALLLFATLLCTTVAGVYIYRKLSKRNQKKEQKEEQQDSKSVSDEPDVITFAKNPQELEFERKLFEKTNRSSRHIKLTEESSSTVAPSLNMEPVKEEEKKEEKKEPIEEQPAQTPEEEEKIKASYEECTRFFSKGKKHYLEHNYDEAIAAYNDAYAICPLSKESERKMILYSRASCYKKLNQHENAIRDLTDAITIDPLYLKAYISRGQIYEYINDVDHALYDYCVAYNIEIVVNGRYMEPNEQFSVLMNNKAKEVTKEYIQKRQEDPTFNYSLPSDSFIKKIYVPLKDDELYVFNPSNKTIEQLLAEVSTVPENELGDVYAALGDEYMKSSQYNNSYEYYQKALNTGSCTQPAVLYNKLSFYLFYKGETEKAWEAIHKAEELGGRNLYTISRQIAFYTELQQFDQVEELLKEGLEKYPDSLVMNYTNGLYGEVKQDYEQAKNAYMKCLEIDNNNGIIYSQLASLMMKQGNIQLYRCNEYIEKALEFCSKSVYVHCLYGDILLIEGRGDLAEKEYKDAITIDPSVDTPYINLAMLYIKGYSDISTAELYLQNAIQVDPSSYEAYELLASCCHLKRDYKTAMIYVQQALETCKSNILLEKVISTKIFTELNMKAFQFIEQEQKKL